MFVLRYVKTVGLLVQGTDFKNISNTTGDKYYKLLYCMYLYLV